MTKRLPRVLGLFDVSVLSSASMGPAYSLASTMGLMVAAAAGLAPLALLLLALVMVCVAASFARLSRALPSAGSSYAWIAAAFGRSLGVYAAWILLVSNLFATMATAVPAGVYTLELIAPRMATSPAWEAMLGVVWILASALLLRFGLRPTALTTAIFVIAELSVLGASGLASFFVHPAAEAMHRVPSLPWPQAAGGVVSAMVLAIWMLDGWEVSASTSEETRGPGATAGHGGLIGLFVTATLLVLVMSAYLHAGTVAGFTEHQADAMAYVADRLGGGAWRVAIVTTVLISSSSALWTTLLYLTRSVYAMGRDGVLPSALGRLGADGSPTTALMAVSAILSAVTLLNGFWPTVASALQFVVSGSSVFLGLLFLGSSLAAVRLAPSLGAGDFMASPFVSLAGALGLGGILAVSIVQADTTVRLVDAAFLVAGIPFVFLCKRAQTPGTDASPAPCSKALPEV